MDSSQRRQTSRLGRGDHKSDRHAGQGGDDDIVVRQALALGLECHRAGDFQCGVDLVRLARRLGHAHHPGLERPFAAFLDPRVRQLAPARAAIVGAIDIDRRGAGVHPVGIVVTDKEAPDLHALVGKLGALETGAVRAMQIICRKISV